MFDTDGRVVTLGLARMADALGNSFLIIVLPLYIASGQVSLDGIVGVDLAGFVLREETLIGLVLSLFGLLNSVGQLVTGRLSDRLGRRRDFVLSGLAVFAVGSAVYPLVSSYWAVLAARALQGVGAALTVPATVALVNEYAATDRERGGNFGVFNTFRLVGFGFGPIVAVLGAALSFALVVLLIEDPPRTEADAGTDLSLAVLDRERGGLDPVFTLGVGTFLMATTIALFATLEGPVRARLDESTFAFSVQFAAVVIANVLLQVPVGRASDRYGRRPFIVAGFAILVPAVFAQGVVTTPLAMLVARFVQGVAVALVFAPSLALAGDLAGAGESGTTLSVLTMAFGLGVAVGPLASGILFNLGGFETPFFAGAALAVVALALVYSQVEDTLDAPATPVPQD